MRECPELIIGVPLHSGQWAERRLKKEISQVTALKMMPPMNTSRASRLGSVKMRTSAVMVTAMLMKCSAEKTAATLKGRLEGSERAWIVQRVFLAVSPLLSGESAFILRAKYRSYRIVSKY